MSRETRYKTALGNLEPDIRTAILYLESLIHDKHREALSAIPRAKPPDLSPVLVRTDSLQKQIDGLKARVKDLKDFKDSRTTTEERIEALNKRAIKFFDAVTDLLQWLRDHGYFKEGDLIRLRESGFFIKKE